MDIYRLENVVRTNRLRAKYGDEVALTEDDAPERDAVYKIVLEFDLAGRSYAVLAPAEDADGELSVYRVVTEDGEERIETIEDDDEWEDVSELVDEMMLAGADDAGDTGE